MRKLSKRIKNVQRYLSGINVHYVFDHGYMRAYKLLHDNPIFKQHLKFNMRRYKLLLSAPHAEPDISAIIWVDYLRSHTPPGHIKSLDLYLHYRRISKMETRPYLNAFDMELLS